MGEKSQYALQSELTKSDFGFVQHTTFRLFNNQSVSAPSLKESQDQSCCKSFCHAVVKQVLWQCRPTGFEGHICVGS